MVEQQRTFSQLMGTPWAWLPPVLALGAMLLIALTDSNRELFFHFNQLSHYTGAWIWQQITTFGDSLIVFSLALLFIERRPQLLWALFFSAMVSTLIVHGLKEWMLVMRPPAVLPPELLTVIGKAHKAVSFPSGHTTAAFTMAALLCLQPISRHWKVLILSLAVLVGISRMAVGVHWPLDVLGGVLDVLTFAVAAIGGISLLVGAIGIVTIMTIAVNERTNEIGLLRALGARQGQVLSLFLGEAIVLAAIGGLSGLILGAGLAHLLHAAIPALPVHTSIFYVVLAELIAVTIGLLAGVLPARRAAQMDPVEALRAE